MVLYMTTEGKYALSVFDVHKLTILRKMSECVVQGLEHTTCICTFPEL